MRTEASAVFESEPATANRVSKRRSPTAALVLMPLACVASCTVGPVVTGDAGGDGRELRDAAPEQRELEAEAAPPEAPLCATDPECAAPTPYCVAGVCASTRRLGSACTSPPECPSGHCVDGVRTLARSASGVYVKSLPPGTACSVSTISSARERRPASSSRSRRRSS
jgi:hypothetical protein